MTHNTTIIVAGREIDYIVQSGEQAFTCPPGPQTQNCTRRVTCQSLRVFLNLGVIVSGRNHMAITSVSRARLSPQSGEPISPDRPAGPGLLLSRPILQISHPGG